MQGDLPSASIIRYEWNEGIPLLYALNPQSWQLATRRVTLRLPDVRRLHRGTVVDEAGEPVAGLPIELYSVHWNGANWMFPHEVEASGRVRSWRAVDGLEIEPIRTDDEGRYSIPLYAGSTSKFDTFREGWSLSDVDGFEATERAVWTRWRHRTDRVDPEKFKQVTVVFEDEQGNPLPTVTLDWVKGYTEGKLVYNYGGGAKDSHGLHLFPPRSVDHLEVKTSDPKRKWNPLETTLDVTGPDDRVVRVTMDESLRWRPLAETGLDPDGQPVPNARVSPFKPADQVRDRSWNSVLVKQQDQVVSGAEVTVYATAAQPEDLARWMQQWKSSNTAVRKAALTMLHKAGALAVDAIGAAEDDQFGLDKLIADLADVGIHDLCELRSDGLDRLAQDLTDAAGTVRCEIEQGRHCVAVARVRGRLVGWKSFVAEGATVTVDMRPARALLVRFEEAARDSDEHRDHWLYVRLEQPASLANRALLSALTHAHGRSSSGWLSAAAVLDRQYAMQADGPATWLLEDLPVNTDWTVTLHNTSTDSFREALKQQAHKPRQIGRVRIEPGDGMQAVQW